MARWLEEQWEKRSAVCWALAPLSWVYAFGWEAYASLYRAGIKQSERLHTLIVCVGNLRVGGSGKTPLCLHIADLLAKDGRDVVLGMSGYGSPASAGAAIAPDGELSARTWGDEPAMARWLRPEIPIVVGRDRRLAARLVAERYSGHVLLMDDGFQHLPLKKDVCLVVDEPGHNSWCLPAGPYREPRRNRKRAAARIPDDFKISRNLTGFITPYRQQVSAPTSCRVVSSIARPSRFIDDLKGAGASIVNAQLLPDHDPLLAPGLLEGLGDVPVVCTAKDWVKLRERADICDHQVYIAESQTQFENPDAFICWLGGLLEQK